MPGRPVPEAVRDVMERAWLEEQPVRIVYDGARGFTERRIRLRSIVMERTETLLNCTDLDIGEPRQFRLHKICEAALLDGMAGA